MTSLLWFLAGATTLAPFLGAAIHLFLTPSVKERAIAEGRRQVLQAQGIGSVPAPRRRSPDHQLVTRQFVDPPARPVFHDPR